jgi:hypothetical protein
VTECLQRLETVVYPDYGMFRVHDLAADPPDPDLVPGPAEFASFQGDRLWVTSLQSNVPVRLTLEEWSGRPEQGLDAAEAEALGAVVLHGAVAVTEVTTGPVLHGLRLAGGLASYRVRVQARDRERVADEYARLFGLHEDVTGAAFARDRRRLEGVERYLLQLWPGDAGSKIGPPFL